MKVLGQQLVGLINDEPADIVERKPGCFRYVLYKSAWGADEDVNLGLVRDDMVRERLRALQIQTSILVVRVLRVNEAILLPQILLIPLRIVPLLFAQDDGLLLLEHSVAHRRANLDPLGSVDGESRGTGLAGELHLLDKVSCWQDDECSQPRNAPLADVLHHRKHVGEGLSGAGRRSDHYVALPIRRG